MRFLVIYVLFKTINNNQYLHIMIMYVVLCREDIYIDMSIDIVRADHSLYDSRMTNKVYPKFKHHINHTMKCTILKQNPICLYKVGYIVRVAKHIGYCCYFPCTHVHTWKSYQ